MKQLAAYFLSSCFTWFISTCYADNLTELSNAKNLKCIFHQGVITTLKSGLPNIEKGEFGEDAIFFDSIDFQTQKATMRSNIGTIDNIKAFFTQKGLTFIDITPAGNFIMTTIFPNKNKNEEFPAVTSRHINIIFAAPIPSQYYGFCKIEK